MLSKEKFEEIYNGGLAQCERLCNKRRIVNNIQMYKEGYLTWRDLISWSRRNFDCYECACSPDVDYMYGELDKLQLEYDYKEKRERERQRQILANQLFMVNNEVMELKQILKDIMDKNTIGEKNNG